MGTEAAFRQNVHDVFFDFDSYDLRPDARPLPPRLPPTSSRTPTRKIVIGGYADERGSAEYNLALGENRANAARTRSGQRWRRRQPLRVISFGKEKQFCTESNEACWQQNRRAQFSIDR